MHGVDAAFGRRTRAYDGMMLCHLNIVVNEEKLAFSAKKLAFSAFLGSLQRLICVKAGKTELRHLTNGQPCTIACRGRLFSSTPDASRALEWIRD